jgi:hypothetical protein
MPIVAVSESQVAVHAWSLYGVGHVLAASIARDDPFVEARILLDGTLIYRSRHASYDEAQREVLALRAQWTGDGWMDIQ